MSRSFPGVVVVCCLVTLGMAQIIRQVMSAKGLQPSSIPEKYRLQSVYGHGSLTCKTCSHKWSSYMAWIKVDLKQCKVLRHFQQKCNSCEVTCVPFIDDSEFRRMIELAVERAVGLMEGTHVRRDHKRLEAPHDSSRCEKCGFGSGKPCYD